MPEDQSPLCAPLPTATAAARCQANRNRLCDCARERVGSGGAGWSCDRAASALGRTVYVTTDALHPRRRRGEASGVEKRLRERGAAGLCWNCCRARPWTICCTLTVCSSAVARRPPASRRWTRWLLCTSSGFPLKTSSPPTCALPSNPPARPTFRVIPLAPWADSRRVLAWGGDPCAVQTSRT